MIKHWFLSFKFGYEITYLPINILDFFIHFVFLLHYKLFKSLFFFIVYLNFLAVKVSNSWILRFSTAHNWYLNVVALCDVLSVVSLYLVWLIQEDIIINLNMTVQASWSSLSGVTWPNWEAKKILMIIPPLVKQIFIFIFWVNQA